MVVSLYKIIGKREGLLINFIYTSTMVRGHGGERIEILLTY